MKTNVILAAWAIAATAAAVTNCNTNRNQVAEPTEPITEFVAPRFGSINVTATPNEYGALTFSADFTDYNETVNPLDYDGLRIDLAENLVSFTQHISTGWSCPNDYSMVISVPEKGIYNASLPISWALYELIQAAYFDEMNISFILEFRDGWQQFTWLHDDVLPDYPEAFLDWNL